MMVVKYAQGEAKIATLQGNIDKLEQKLKDKDREKELLAEKLRSLKSESAKHSTNLEERVSKTVKFISRYSKHFNSRTRSQIKH